MTATLPFTLTFKPLPQVTEVIRPALQSFSWVLHPSGNWLMLGGRRAGLHQFKTGGDNFPKPNQSVWRCDPASGSVSELFDLSTIDPAIGDPLTLTNQQFSYDADTGEWLIVGGYGHDTVLDKFRTFDTLIRIPVVPFAATMASEQTAKQKAAVLESIVNVQRDPFFAVTGERYARPEAAGSCSSVNGWRRPTIHSSARRNSATSTPCASSVSTSNGKPSAWAS